MKLLTHALPAAIFAAMVSLSSLSYADDTEIYFARANAENQENKPVANVLIMLDTSGSMRNCKKSDSNNWCSDEPNRRITLLHNAMNTIVENASPTVRLGLGRFHSSSGGRILVPVVPVNSQTRPHLLAALNNINDGKGKSGSKLGDVEPKGGTPTSLAYDEMADYMLGRNTGYSYGNKAPSLCVVEGERDVNCETVVSEWSDWTTIDYCPPDPLGGCEESLDNWQDVEFCNINDNSCEYTSWEPINSCSPVDGVTCKWEGIWIFGQYYSRGYKQATATYRVREALVSELQCETETYCSETVETVASNGKYVSPMNMNNQCESNHIILFTDGEPSGDSPKDVGIVSCSGLNSYSCQEKIAKHLNSENNSKKRAVTTHNIGLYMGSATLANMQGVSKAGGGETYDSDSADSLLEAFQQTLDLIDEESRSTSAPGVAVNALNRFQHLDELFYAVFQPVESSYWEGNLKKYKWTVVNGVGEIQGASGTNVIDDDTGYFKENARSLWSSEADGRDATKGGAREQVGKNVRKLFYTTEPNGTIHKLDWNSANTPSNIQLGVSKDDDSKRDGVLSRLKTMWGDPLHSVPFMVNYGSEDEYENVIFVSTNAGMLHAIDAKTGVEKFAFMPHEFLKQATRYTTDRPSLNQDNTRQTYGLDGSWIAWQRSADNGGKIYLYGGMRRGGGHYYALDVSNPDKPVMQWQISNETEGFSRLGQTWSTPTLTNVKVDGNTVPALVFGGGYDPEKNDGYRNRSAGDDMGNAVYVINALNGELIWSIGGDVMKWAIPSSIAVVDADFDNAADHLYFGDMGGQVFRIDLPGSEEGSPELVKLADLGDASGTNQRRFYEAPAVAYVEEDGQQLLYVVISSGYRAHPLDETTNDGLFAIRDASARRAGTSHAVVTLNTMTNVVTAAQNPIGSWYYLFKDEADRVGEKGMSSPVIFDGKILQSTYAPTAQDAEDENPCAVRYGAAFLHTVDLRTGAPASLAGEVPGNRSRQLDQSTPPPTPTLLVNEDGELVAVIGTEPVGEGDFGNVSLRRHRWMQLPRNEANAIKADVMGETDEQGD